jgi:hypothetical protein
MKVIFGDSESFMSLLIVATASCCEVAANPCSPDEGAGHWLQAETAFEPLCLIVECS